MKPHIRYLIKPDMPHNGRVKAAAANNSGLGKWKVTPHLDQNMDKPWKSHDTGVPRTGRKDFRHGSQDSGGSWSLSYALYNMPNDHGQTEPPKRNKTGAVADDS
ncbi:hypothetical protein PENFLA_c004G07220 [Penicillium flavigenum]|uniref:Uncharacterized protein n=1 Tax=Penicillium flavigenum TaxID=254877 RepID=A0A1V6TRW5_9EURO|nr:hypothetical protein PENFLA_c004G07220 [Penicillium flavigenum]